MRIFGLNISADRTALPCTLLLWMGLAVAAGLVFRLSLLDAVAAGALATAIHWLSALWHDTGHVIAARRIGHPMTGLRLWTVFAINQYPPNEGDLPARVHVQRALGGPLASLLLTVMCVVVWLVLPRDTPAWWFALFGVLENLLVMTLQVFLPLGFNDGATLRRWLPKLGH